MFRTLILTLASASLLAAGMLLCSRAGGDAFRFRCNGACATRARGEPPLPN